MFTSSLLLDRMSRRDVLKLAAAGIVVGATSGIKCDEAGARVPTRLDPEEVIREVLFEIDLPKVPFPRRTTRGF